MSVKITLNRPCTLHWICEDSDGKNPMEQKWLTGKTPLEIIHEMVLFHTGAVGFARAQKDVQRVFVDLVQEARVFIEETKREGRNI